MRTTLYNVQLKLLGRRRVGSVGGTRAAVERAAVGERNPAGVDEMRAVAGAVTVDDDRVAEFQVALFQPRRVSASGLAPSQAQFVTLPLSSATST